MRYTELHFIQIGLQTKIYQLDTGTMYDYWSHNPNVLTVNVIKIDKDDLTAVCGQFNSSTDAIVTNLLVYLHDYKQYNVKSKCPVNLTGAVGTKDIHPLGQGFLIFSCSYTFRISCCSLFLFTSSFRYSCEPSRFRQDLQRLA